MVTLIITVFTVCLHCLFYKILLQATWRGSLLGQPCVDVYVAVRVPALLLVDECWDALIATWCCGAFYDGVAHVTSGSPGLQNVLVCFVKILQALGGNSRLDCIARVRVRIRVRIRGSSGHTGARALVQSPYSEAVGSSTPLVHCPS